MSKEKKADGKIQWGRMIRKLNPYTIQKGFRYLKHYGPKEFWIRLHERFEPEEVPYGPWYKAYVPDLKELDRQRREKFDYEPLISVAVPAFRTPEEFLQQMIDSLLAQTYRNWELCIANGSPGDEVMSSVLKEYTARDRRIRVIDLTENKGIAGNTNAALQMAEGEFVGLLDHDDLLAPDALYELAAVLLVALGAFSCATQFKLGALHIAPLALIWGLLSAVAFAFYTITPQKLIQEYSLLPIVGWGMILGGIVLALLCRPWTVAVTVNAHLFIMLAGVIFLGTICSFCFYQAGVSIVGGLAGSILSAAEPVTSVMISTLLLHVLFTSFDLAGFVMILTAIPLIAVGEHWSEKQVVSLRK